jgi:hypothetical protein
VHAHDQGSLQGDSKAISKSQTLGGQEDEEAEHWGSGQETDSVLCYNGRYLSLKICQDPLDAQCPEQTVT